MVDRGQFAGVFLAVGLLVALSASAGTTADEQDPDELVKKAVESLVNESFEAVHTQRISRSEGEVSQTVVVHQRSSGSGYLEVIDRAGEQRQQIQFNDSAVIQRDEEDSTAVRYDRSDDFLLGEYRTLGATPEEVLDHYRGEYAGTTEVDGRESYRVELFPPEQRAASLSLSVDAGDLDYELPVHEASERQWFLSRETWWIDKETFYPIKQSVEWVDRDGSVITTATREYEQLAVGSELADSAVDRATANGTTLPDGESLSDPAEMEPREPVSDSSLVEPDVVETREAANETLPFDLSRVDIPSAYTHERSIVHAGEKRPGVMLLYTHEPTNATLSVQVIEGRASPFKHSTVALTEEIDAFDGKIAVTDSGTEVVRKCEELTYRVRGPPDAETLVDVTGAVEC